MNESGKTSLLEALAKVNYFEADKDFVFNMTHDYPRKQKKTADKSGIIPQAVTLEYELSDTLTKRIESVILLPYNQRYISYTKNYDDKGSFSYGSISIKAFTEKKLAALGIKEQKYIDAVSII